MKCYLVTLTDPFERSETLTMPVYAESEESARKIIFDDLGLVTIHGIQCLTTPDNSDTMTALSTG